MPCGTFYYRPLCASIVSAILWRHLRDEDGACMSLASHRRNQVPSCSSRAGVPEQERMQASIYPCTNGGQVDLERACARSSRGSWTVSLEDGRVRLNNFHRHIITRADGTLIVPQYLSRFSV